ncbi:MAG: hypothetical protein ACJA08_001385 [Cyclobacteriaceae bacterium]|jgi:hypothetical protein
MKQLALIAMIVLFGCQPQIKQLPQEPRVSDPTRDVLTGAWTITNYYTVNNITGDTIFEDRTQYKLYVDGNVMWGLESAEDLSEMFGYGTYVLDGDTLRETMISGSNGFRKALALEGNLFSMDLNIFDDSYTQVHRQDSVTVYEVYDRVN